MDDFDDAIAAVEKAWWASKKLLVAMAHIVLSTVGAFTAMFLDHSTIPSVFSAWIASMTAVAVGHNAIQGRADNTVAANPPAAVTRVAPQVPANQATPDLVTTPAPSAGGVDTDSPPGATPPPPPHNLP